MFGLTLLTCGFLSVAGPWAVLAADKQVLSPQTIVDKDFVGKATVEFLVGEVYLQPGSWAVSSDSRWQAVPLRIVPKDAGTKDRVMVLVSGSTVARLKQLGIGNPAEHFRGKVLRVSGTVERFWKRAGPVYQIRVSSLDEVLAVREI
jgi:hypothetical protein